MPSNAILIFLAIVPTIVLFSYIYYKDKVEKEPIGLLIGLFFLGVLTVVGAAIGESLFIEVLGFKDKLSVGENFVQYLLVVALWEEGFKFLILVLVTKKNKHFNSLFDGIVYAVFVSLGFAALENVLYVLQNGWGNAITRAVLSVPGHMFNAVMMGYYYSLWHVIDKARVLEKDMIAQIGVPSNVPLFSSKKERWLSILVPVFFHGFYNFCCSVSGILWLMTLIGFVVFMYIYCFGKIRKVSKADCSDDAASLFTLAEKYPFLKKSIIEKVKAAAAQAQ
jgi:RsiW-degrading membrane proteinase PrsW (M82 family)